MKGRKSGRYQYSHSQFGDHARCPRRNWFRRMAVTSEGERLPKVQKRSTIIGSVLHKVLERWYEADGTETDESLLLYPDKWHVLEDKSGALSAAEMVTVRKLIEHARVGGYLERVLPRPSIEQELKIPIAGTDTDFVGYIDLLYPETPNDLAVVVDHKTSGGVKFLEKPDTLVHNEQLLTYGGAAAHLGLIRQPYFHVRHNQFITTKQGGKSPVRVVDGERAVSVADAMATFHRRLQAVPEIEAVRAGTHAAKDWEKIEGPRAYDSCDDFGGCPFASICARPGCADPEQPIRDYIRAAGAPQKDSGNLDGSFLNRQNGAPHLLNPKPMTNPLNPGTVPAPVVAQPAAAPMAAAQPIQPIATAPAAAAPVAAPAAAAPAERQPWAHEGCTHCGGVGTKDGQVCRVCDIMNKKDGRATSDQYGAAPTVQGGVAAAAPVAAPAAAPVAAAPAGVMSPGVTTLPENGAVAAAPAAAPVAAQPAAAPVAAAPAPAAEPEPEPAPEKASTAKAPTFALFWGCVATVGPDSKKILRGVELVRELMTQVVPDGLVDTFYSSDQWQRKDWLRAQVRRNVADGVYNHKRLVFTGTEPSTSDEYAVYQELSSLATSNFIATR